MLANKNIDLPSLNPDDFDFNMYLDILYIKREEINDFDEKEIDELLESYNEIKEDLNKMDSYEEKHYFINMLKAMCLLSEVFDEIFEI